jgi:hypothetical protein
VRAAFTRRHALGTDLTGATILVRNTGKDFSFFDGRGGIHGWSILFVVLFRLVAILGVVALAKTTDFVAQALEKFKNCFYHGRRGVFF